MFPFTLFGSLFGGFLVCVGLANVWTGRKDMVRRRRVLATPTSPIATAPGDGLVEIEGRLLAGDQGPLTAPLSGRAAVWCRVTVSERRQSGKNSYWHTLLTETDARPFFVEDASGRARIQPDQADVFVDREKVATSGTFHDATPALETFLAARGLSSTSWVGFNKQMKFEEELLVPGDRLYALGPARREAGPARDDGYRTGPSTELVLFAGGDELVLSNKRQAELVGVLMRRHVTGLALVIAGVLLIVAGLVLG